MEFLVEGDQFVVNIDRGDEEDLGLSIAKQGRTTHGYFGFFFVKSLTPESPADCCNKLMKNDIILKVIYNHEKCSETVLTSGQQQNIKRL